MKSSVLSAVIVAVIIVVGTGVYFLSRESDEPTIVENSQSVQDSAPAARNNTSNQPASSTEEVAESFTTEQVAVHNTEDDCWTIIEGSVYDITSYIPRHPGGSNILSACGVDATEFFNGDKRGQSGGSNDHSNDTQARNALAQLKIGELVQ